MFYIAEHPEHGMRLAREYGVTITIYQVKVGEDWTYNRSLKTPEQDGWKFSKSTPSTNIIIFILERQ